MSDLKYYLALNFIPDVGPVTAGRLLAAFGKPGNIFQASAHELKQVEDIGENRAGNITGFNQWDIVQKEIEKAEKNKVRLIARNDPAYPETLKRIHGAPMVLYVKGGLKDDDRYAIAMVGSRTSTHYGMQMAEKMSHKLASSGLTVVSGMARGIDSASHRGALKAGGRTVAVLGSGIDVPYPPENKKLVDDIASSGAVVSEFPLGALPNRENFPRRNRIISGLSLGVIVIEATLDSGSLITVAYALEQGKDVFAVPGNVTSRTSKGTNDLIKKGAKLVESAEEVLDELRPQIKGFLREEKINTAKPLPAMSAEEQTVYHSLSNEPKHIDSIIREINIPTNRALSVLLGLELKGVVRQLQGKNFSLN
ncbi:MAG: DNA-protecting protein DprA [Nitrospiraceae bacterium]|nr:MAG: DNA-protecting protein DprA [Nitrospiraceae bacterium]